MRWLPLILFLYVAADFANPLMPGAVSLEDGWVEAQRRDRPREDGPAVLDGHIRVPSLPAGDLAVLARVSVKATTPRALTHGHGPWRSPVRRGLLESRDPSTPSEAH
jgi:hypothetical protein